MPVRLFGMDVSYWDVWAELHAIPFTVEHAAVVHITCAAFILFFCSDQVKNQN